MKDDKVKKRPSSKQEDEKFVEDDDQRVIVFVAIAILVIIGVVIGLLVGCQKEEEKELEDPNKQTEKEDNNKKEDKVVKYEEEDEDESDNLVVKTSTKSKKKKERKTFTVEFLLTNNNDSQETKIKEGKKVLPIDFDGYNQCVYYADLNGDKEFDFSSPITKDTIVYMDCTPISYDIEYVGDFTANTNPDEYDVEDGSIDLVKPTTEYVFLGWYLDSGFNIEVTSLKPEDIGFAKQNVITLYAKIVEAVEVNYHYDYANINSVVGVNITDVNFIIDYVGPTIVVPEGKTFYGWSTNIDDHKIMYKEDDRIILKGDLDLYPVYGNAKIVFQSESEVVEERVYTDEELESVTLPDDKSLDMDAPTYYVKVDEATDNSKEVVDDETTPTDKQVKVGDVTDKKGSAYDTPTVGDLVEEHEKEFEGWETTVPDPTDPLKEVEVPVDESFEFTEEETTLDAVWDEKEEDKKTEIPKEESPTPPELNSSAPEEESTPEPEPKIVPEVVETEEPVEELQV